MRRNDREIINRAELIAILKQAEVCRIALSDHDTPYIVPLNFGIQDGNPLVLYFHSAPVGRKLDIIRNNNKACFEVETDTKVVVQTKACSCSMQYRSVIGVGHIEIVSGEQEKKHGLDMIMKHYTNEEHFDYDPRVMERTVILKLVVEEISGKEHFVNN